MSKRKNITISILDNLLSKTKAVATTNNRSFSNQVEEWIKEKLETKKAK